MRLSVTLAPAFPRKMLTRLVGSFARSRLSKSAIPLFARRYRVAIDEAEKSLTEYRTLTEFFTRRLKTGARPIHQDGRIITSPCDGVLSETGVIEQGRLIQAKGISYSLSQMLMCDPALTARFEGGFFATIYLSPSDYHRIHMPLDGRIVGYAYVPGTFYPVNRVGVSSLPGLFVKNERLATLVDSEYGRFVIVKVGALIVGGIQSVYERRDPRLQSDELTWFSVADCVLDKGDELAYFEFGSTVVLIFEPGMVELSSVVAEGERLFMGMRLASLGTTRT